MVAYPALSLSPFAPEISVPRDGFGFLPVLPQPTYSTIFYTPVLNPSYVYFLLWVSLSMFLCTAVALFLNCCCN